MNSTLIRDTAWLQGPTNPLALRRTFGQPGEPEVKLYRRGLPQALISDPVHHAAGLLLLAAS